MIALMILLLASSSVPALDKPTSVADSLVELFRLTDEYRQCLVLDRSLRDQPRDTFFAEGGTSAENLDLSLSDKQDRLLKFLIGRGRGEEVLDAIQRVQLSQVHAEQCRDFDPYYGPASDKLRELEQLVGLNDQEGQKRWRRDRPR